MGFRMQGLGFGVWGIGFCVRLSDRRSPAGRWPVRVRRGSDAERRVVLSPFLSLNGRKKGEGKKDRERGRSRGRERERASERSDRPKDVDNVKFTT